MSRSSRVFDLVVAVVLAPVVFPLMVIIGLTIRVVSGGPVIFCGPRIGTHGELFEMLKFRTMSTDGDVVLAQHFREHPEARIEYARTMKLQDDPRVTRFGRFLRASNLDELPQFVNILRGDMAMVGPRPKLPEEVQVYGPEIWTALSVRQGLTGLWQTSGRNNLSYEERIALDLRYARERSVAGDLKICLRTALQMLSGKNGAC